MAYRRNRTNCAFASEIFRQNAMIYNCLSVFCTRIKFLFVYCMFWVSHRKNCVRHTLAQWIALLYLCADTLVCVWIASKCVRVRVPNFRLCVSSRVFFVRICDWMWRLRMRTRPAKCVHQIFRHSREFKMRIMCGKRPTQQRKKWAQARKGETVKQREYQI